MLESELDDGVDFCIDLSVEVDLPDGTPQKSSNLEALEEAKVELEPKHKDLS